MPVRESCCTHGSDELSWQLKVQAVGSRLWSSFPVMKSYWSTKPGVARVIRNSTVVPVPDEEQQHLVPMLLSFMLLPQYPRPD